MDAILGVSIRSSLKPWALGFDLEEPPVSDRQDHETPTFGWLFAGWSASYGMFGQGLNKYAILVGAML